MTPLTGPRFPIDLGRDECNALLASASVGRVAYSDRALPQVIPVNYAMDGACVVFRTSAQSRLAICCRDAVVAFEVDQVDEGQHLGWSVLVVGSATAITEDSEVLRARQLRFAPWVAGERDHFVRITPGVVTGRALMPLAPAEAS